MTEQQTEKKIGLVLSGGGARGIAHIGVMKALEQHGIFPEIISGTSAGAIAGSLYAYGFTPDEMLKIIKEVNYLRSLRAGFWRMGLISSTTMHAVLSRYLLKNDFSELKKKLFVTITNLKSGHAVYVSSGELIQVVVASSAIPVMMTPVSINNELFIDGGVVNNLPVDPIREIAFPILGVSVNPEADNHEVRSIRNVGERAFHIAINQNVKMRIPMLDWFLEPEELSQFGLLDMKKADKIFHIGYDAAMRKLEREHPLRDLGK